MQVLTREFWAFSDTDRDPTGIFIDKADVTRQLTVYLAPRPFGPRVVAQVCLSRIDGPGTAAARIRRYSFFPFTSPDPIDIDDSYSGPTDTLQIVLHGKSTARVNNTHSVTFELQVSNVFAYATCTIFVFPRPIREQIVMFPQSLLARGLTVVGLSRRSRGEFRAGHSSRPPSSDTQVVFDRETGEILTLHESVAVRGARVMPVRSRDTSLKLAAATSGTPAERLGIVTVPTSDLRPGTTYRVDPSRNTLIARTRGERNGHHAE